MPCWKRPPFWIFVWHTKLCIQNNISFIKIIVIHLQHPCLCANALSDIWRPSWKMAAILNLTLWNYEKWIQCTSKHTNWHKFHSNRSGKLVSMQRFIIGSKFGSHLEKMAAILDLIFWKYEKWIQHTIKPTIWHQFHSNRSGRLVSMQWFIIGSKFGGHLEKWSPFWIFNLPPPLKINFIVCSNIGKNFMLLS
jgi:hypothetical protein